MTKFKTVSIDLENNDVQIISSKNLCGNRVLINGNQVKYVKSVSFNQPFINEVDDIKKSVLHLTLRDDQELFLND